jgi:hypothetical protein
MAKRQRALERSRATATSSAPQPPDPAVDAYKAEYRRQRVQWLREQEELVATSKKCGLFFLLFAQLLFLRHIVLL